MRRSSSLLLLASALGACNWAQFDDLASSTWVNSEVKPGNVDSSDWAVTIVKGANPRTTGVTNGGAIGLLGRSKSTYSVVAYDPQGVASVDGGKVVRLNDTVGIAQLFDVPMIVADPKSPSVALLGPSGSNTTVLAASDPSTDTFAGAIVGVPATPTGLAYLHTAAGATQIVVAVKDTSTPPKPQLFVYTLAVSQTPVVCTMPADIAAIAPIADAAGDGLAVWGADGSVAVFDKTISDCTAASTPAPVGQVASGVTPAVNARIAMDGTFAVLASPGVDGKIVVADLTAPAAPVMVSGGVLAAGGLVALDAATIGDAGAKKHVLAAGFPTKQIDGVTTGQVELYEYSAAGLNLIPSEVLHDAQPDAEEAFGRGVAFVPYNGSPALAVAASNELFMYFQTAHYGNLRTP